MVVGLLLSSNCCASPSDSSISNVDSAKKKAPIGRFGGRRAKGSAANVVEDEPQLSAGVASRRLLPASTATVGRWTASGHRRFFNVSLFAAPRYRWWLRQTLCRL